MSAPPPLRPQRRGGDRTGAAATSRRRGRSWGVGAGTALVRRPDLWSTAVRQALRLAPTGWWRRWPPVPRPDPAYFRFRMETAYGDGARQPLPADVVAYLEWCREWSRQQRDHRRAPHHPS